LADAISEKFGLTPKLVGGAGGIFDVQVDGSLIFSKHQTGRFPEVQEIIDAIQQTR